MTTQEQSVVPANIDPETIKRFVAEGRRQRSLAFHAFFAGLFRSDVKASEPEIPAGTVCCNQ